MWLVIAAAGLAVSASGWFGERPGPEVWPIPPPVGWVENRALVELGEALFAARELSADGSIACADCHQPELAFTDGHSRALGIGGAQHRRSAPSLTYVAWAATLGWADPRPRELEDQALEPLLDPREMGLLGREEVALERLSAPKWQPQLEAAFGDATPTLDRVVTAIAAFERTLGPFSSRFDTWMRGELELTTQERHGMALFFSERLGCASCHGGVLFAGPVRHQGEPGAGIREAGVRPLWRRTGVVGEDRGLEEHTGDPDDRHRFKVPTLRNIARTAPYFHDGRARDLNQVLDFYATGPDRDPALRPFRLEPAEREALLLFLAALSDAEEERDDSARPSSTQAASIPGSAPSLRR
jgi:cytochrome c peroxidase